jgi:uncharacterized protein (UPF0261 family)
MTGTAGLLYLEFLRLRHEILRFHHTRHHGTGTGGSQKGGFTLDVASAELLTSVMAFLVTSVVDVLEGSVASALRLFIPRARFGIL